MYRDDILLALDLDGEHTYVIIPIGIYIDSIRFPFESV